MFTTKIYLNSCHLCFPNNSAVKKALQTRSFKIFATRTRQEITKRENSSSKKHNLSKIELFIPLKILNYFFTDTGHPNSVRKSLPTWNHKKSMFWTKWIRQQAINKWPTDIQIWKDKNILTKLTTWAKTKYTFR